MKRKKEPTKAITPKRGNFIYLKNNEEYDIIEIVDHSDNYGYSFKVKSKLNCGVLFCLEKGCAHLNGGSWKLIQK